MPVYSIYDIATGRILAQIIGRLSFGTPGNGIIEGEVDPQTYYFNPDTEQVDPRPAMPSIYTTNELDANTEAYFRVDNIPEGTQLLFPGNNEQVIDDGFFEWTTDLPGTYEFTLKKFPYQTVTYHATFS